MKIWKKPCKIHLINTVINTENIFSPVIQIQILPLMAEKIGIYSMWVGVIYKFGVPDFIERVVKNMYIMGLYKTICIIHG